METKNKEQRDWLARHLRFMGTKQLAADHPRQETKTESKDKIPA